MQKIKTLAIGIAAILVASCATQQYYATTVNSWQGMSQQQLFQAWGYPSRQMQLQNGHTVYVYNSRTITNPQQTYISGTTDVQQSGGQTYVTRTHSSNQASQIARCTTWFEADKTGTIVGTSFNGDGCVASAKFSKQYAAQGFD